MAHGHYLPLDAASFDQPPKGFMRNRKMREREVEKYFVQQVTKHGGRALKFTGYRNAPDRIVVWPYGNIHFVELKAPGEKPRRGQAREHARLRELGCIVRVLSTKELVDQYVGFHAP